MLYSSLFFSMSGGTRANGTPGCPWRGWTESKYHLFYLSTLKYLHSTAMHHSVHYISSASPAQPSGGSSWFEIMKQE